MADTPKRPRKQRSDAARNREHILDVATELLAERPRASMADVAEAAEVARGTLYRHFPTRGDLVGALDQAARDHADSGPDRLRPPGELAREVPTPLSVADVLNKVPPHLVGEQIVAEAQRIPGVSAAAVYLVDLDGTSLARLAGAATFPTSMPVPLAVGTEVPREGLPALKAAVEEHLSGAVSAPLLLRGRALGVLVAVGSAPDKLEALAYEAAAALGLAQVYTDFLDSVRRVQPTSPAAEIQQNLLPPRIVRSGGALIAGNVLPGYEIGGDWFDYAENPDGTWLGIGDTTGNGTRSAALAAVALGAFRSARHQGLELTEVVELMDATVRELGLTDTLLSTTVSLYNAPTRCLRWVTCGHLGPILIQPDGTGHQLEGTHAPPLGDDAGLGDLTVNERRFDHGDRIVFASDGVIDRAYPETGNLAIEGLVDAVRTAAPGSAAAAVNAVEAVLRSMNPAPLSNDATLIVLVPVAPTG